MPATPPPLSPPATAPPGGRPPEAPPGTIWSETPETLFGALASGAGGLTSEEAARRLVHYGPNRIGEARQAGTLRLLAAQFRSPITLLLAGAAALSVALGEGTDGAILLAILLASGGLGFWQEHRAAVAVETLLGLVQTRTRVLRDGALAEVPIEAVVPGDVVALDAGAAVPGDARVLDAEGLLVDEAALTGESYPAEKDTAAVAADVAPGDRDAAVFAGTHVVSGTGRALVVRTGAETILGRVSASVRGRAPETAFERGIRRFGLLLLEVALALALVIFAVNVALQRPVIDALLFTLALTVGLTPQLLPAILSVTLSQGAARMARQRVIVRRLAAIEDIGEVTVLCTDKTGTLTEGVARLGEAVDADGAPSPDARRFAYLNATLQEGYANPIDEAIRRAAPPDVEGYARAGEVPYDFRRRRLSVAVQRTAGPDAERLLVTKGAVADVLGVCTEARSASGEARPLDAARAAIQARFESLSADGYRCLALAVRPLAPGEAVAPEAERAMTFVGLVPLLDPPKAGAAASLDALRGLGIAVKIVTGDNRHVAATVARAVRIDAAALLTGDDVRGLRDAALVERAARTDVFAEMDPNQKERVIRALQKGGAAVAYLGDGINDAAALHAADVGISVDTAVEVTKQAADVVLLEKDLGVLVAGVREGRGAFANTLKYVFITTSASFGNMVSMAVASLFTSFLPMLPKQVLLLNALSDLPAMGIASDHLDPEMVAAPQRLSTHAIGRFMVAFGLVSSVFDMATFGALLALHAPAATFRTAWFTESVLSEILILLVIRTRRPFFRSRPGEWMAGMSAAVAVAVLALPYTPLAGPLGFAPLSADLVAVVVGVLVAYVAASEAVKRVAFPRGLL